MKFLIVLCLIILPFDNFAQDKKVIATSVAQVSGLLFPKADGNGNLLAKNENAIILIGPDGRVIRKVAPNDESFFIPINKQAMVGFSTPVLKFYSTKEELKKLGEVSGEGFGANHLALKNGDVLIARSGVGYLKIVGTDGTTKFQVDVETKKVGLAPAEFSDGTIVVSSVGKHIFFSPELKQLKQIDENCNSKGVLEHVDLLVCDGIGSKLSFLTSKGEVKFSFNPNNKRLNSILSLPNGLIALMVDDGYIYFLDAEGNKRFSHFHDTDAVSDLVLVSDKVLAYWNKTEIVFLDFEGKEVGTSPLIPFNEPSAPHSLKRNRLIGLGQGNVVAINGKQVLFIKLN